MTQPTFKERLIENSLIYIGMTLIFASLIFYGLLQYLVAMRQALFSESTLQTLQLIQETGMVFIFALWAACSLAGMVYAVMKAWQRIKAPSDFSDDEVKHS
ncbi:hypothetical protein [Providencia alcalifaciens]|uniref:Uncharacterized protein n=1 Tax=Providencia alcalifaciens 205/92 TaxID=1256988 RepID=A0AAV3M837_9GAMM|nr:hypothetical protein [Providencia alcalifaciens]EBW1331199.1 hypothetical protein [Salmonella enterica subsp. enterica serovar Enteritidis]EUD04188.1 hypothetical protein HMPREF1565_0651 [Providencia alcalifaciens RIMD 1656011]EUD11690.1 hypothetical protein HMPREF1563_0313 [Providencia alcalifaciens 205/92]MTC26499.1 hypothetical protein [Providencia alcalifaciens]MTC62432.1 hypothetical protein [Providencia alcalifaciens]